MQFNMNRLLCQCLFDFFSKINILDKSINKPPFKNFHQNILNNMNLQIASTPDKLPLDDYMDANKYKRRGSKFNDDWPRDLELQLLRLYKKYQDNWTSIYEQLKKTKPRQMDLVPVPNIRKLINKMVALWKKGLDKLLLYGCIQSLRLFNNFAKSLKIAYKVEGFFYVKALLLEFYFADEDDICQQDLKALTKFVHKLENDQIQETEYKKKQRKKSHNFMHNQLIAHVSDPFAHYYLPIPQNKLSRIKKEWQNSKIINDGKEKRIIFAPKANIDQSMYKQWLQDADQMNMMDKDQVFEDKNTNKN